MIDKKFCWNGRDESLRRSIERSNYVKKIREKLIEKKMLKINGKVSR